MPWNDLTASSTRPVFWQGMLKKAASGVLALLSCSRTMSTLRASKCLRSCWTRLFEHPLLLWRFIRWVTCERHYENFLSNQRSHNIFPTWQIIPLIRLWQGEARMDTSPWAMLGTVDSRGPISSKRWHIQFSRLFVGILASFLKRFKQAWEGECVGRCKFLLFIPMEVRRIWKNALGGCPGLAITTSSTSAVDSSNLGKAPKKTT